MKLNGATDQPRVPRWGYGYVVDGPQADAWARLRPFGAKNRSVRQAYARRIAFDLDETLGCPDRRPNVVGWQMRRDALLDFLDPSSSLSCGR